MKTFKIENRVWKLRNEKNGLQLWTSGWICDDGDSVQLYITIDNDCADFELQCFSGIPASHIYIDESDMGRLLKKAYPDKSWENYKNIEAQLYIADWLCDKFCEYHE